MKYVDENFSWGCGSGDVSISCWAGNGHADTSYSVSVQGAAVLASKPSNHSLGTADSLRGKLLSVAITVAITNGGTAHVSVSTQLSGSNGSQTFTTSYTLSDSERNGGLNMITFKQKIALQ